MIDVKPAAFVSPRPWAACLLAAALMLPASASLAEGAAAPEQKASGVDAALEGLDKFFGDYFVGPMASFFFWDVAFWDNTVPPASLVGGQTKDGQTILAFEDGKGFHVAVVQSVARETLTPKMDVGSVQMLGPIPVEMKRVGEDPAGVVKSATVPLGGRATGLLSDWAGAPFSRADGEAAFPDDAVVVQGLAPFPVVGTVDGERLSLIPIEVRVPKETIAIAAGGEVFFEGRPMKVNAIMPGTSQVQISDPAGAWVPQDKVDLSNSKQTKLPFIVLWLVLGASFFTLRMGFINLRGFVHAIRVTKGDYDNDDDPGEISHFQALSSALSATVGLGNIAGVALAVAAGGPGAIFWMVVAGFLGMSSKFTECTLGQMYRHVDEKGVVSGGPMRYLRTGLDEVGAGGLGKILAPVFAVMCIGGSLGGGNMFQANQAFSAVSERIPALADYSWLFGIGMAVLVGLVIIGGIKRIGAAASLLVPAMCGIYLLAGLWILIANIDKLGAAFTTIISSAMSLEAGFGGLIGVLIVGFQRAAFSNEAGVGSASIAHSAASTDEPVREGIVALLEPFIDTIVVCTMTGLVVVITDAYQSGAGDGVLMTSFAFGSVISWFPWLLSVAVLLFAFSTMISWSYYGERCFTLLFGAHTSMVYRVIFLFFVFFGSVFKLGNVLDFSDLMVLGMAFPNILGMYFLAGKVKGRLDDYWGRLESGAMPRNE